MSLTQSDFDFIIEALNDYPKGIDAGFLIENMMKSNNPDEFKNRLKERQKSRQEEADIIKGKLLQIKRDLFPN